LEKLITEIERQTSKLNCAQNEEVKEKEKHQLEENCKKYVKNAIPTVWVFMLSKPKVL